MSRSFDRIVGAAVLVLYSPILLVIAVLIRLRMGHPVLFSQERAGLNGEPFRLVKFRTMADMSDADGTPRRDDERLTPLGRWLRATSLDELPELWNVVKGDMALVGPRPLPTTYLGRFTAEELRRHDVPPGITGWAQVNGRNTVDWDERLAMDVWYVDHRSFRLDVQIILRTIATVIRREGVSAAGTETMYELRPHLASHPGRDAG